MKKKAATLIYGNSPNYIDHLSPLSHLLNIPIITNEENIYNLIKKYYPEVQALLIDNKTFNFYVVKNFDNIIACTPKNIFDIEFRFQQDVLNKEIKIIWCPHGNSDKGKTIIFFEGLKSEKNVLVYGKKMIDILKEKKVFSSIENVFQIGNYRYDYFKKFKKIFNKIIENQLAKNLPNNNLNILYAPTWEDKENSTSFWKYIDILLSTLPSKFNLIVKIHPNLIKKNEIEIEIMKLKHQQKNIYFLDDFPLIYPLLDFVDVFLGDFSSIGYDFLKFNKPMFFLKPENRKLSSNLFDLGTLINNNKIFETIEKTLSNKSNSNISKPLFLKENHLTKSKKLYDYTFEKNVDLKNLKKIVFS